MDMCICGHSEREHGPTGECRAADCSCKHFKPEIRVPSPPVSLREHQAHADRLRGTGRSAVESDLVLTAKAILAGPANVTRFRRGLGDIDFHSASAR